MKRSLIIGAGGQLGSELTQKLRQKRGADRVVATDIRPLPAEDHDGPTSVLDVMDHDALLHHIERYDIGEIYHLAAVLSAKGEANPRFAWDLNMNSLLQVLEAARDHNIKVFWPSSVAVFGPDTPKEYTPQYTLTNPTTVYGISKLAGERWCEYYHKKYGVDVRSIRYPGLIGYKGKPGGGTTDYAVDIFWKALSDEVFKCFLKPDTQLPMMYMNDAVDGTIQLMDAEPDRVKIRSSYNMAAMSFSPSEIYQRIKQHVPDFVIDYQPDYRQEIADSWPNSLDDQPAREDWGWHPNFDIEGMVRDILSHLKELIPQA